MPIYFRVNASGSGGGGGNSFTTMQPDAGTTPTASTATDTLTFTSTNSTITITGNAGTKTLAFIVNPNLTLTTLNLSAASAGSPSLYFGTSTTGLWGPSTSTIGISISGSEIARWGSAGLMIGTTSNTDSAKLTLKNTGADTQTALQLVSNTNVKIGMAVIGGILDFSDGAVPFFGYDVSKTLMSLGYNAGSPRFRLSMDSSSTETSPANIVTGGSSVLPPMMMFRNTNGTASNFGGIGNCGTSNIINAWVSMHTDTHTSGSEDSHVDIATSNAGTRAAVFRAAKDGDISALTGSVIVATAGKGLKIKEGSDATMGTVNLAGGTAIVSTTAVTANSRIFLTAQVLGGTQGILRVGVVTAGTSFIVTSSNASDTSTVGWLIVEPA